MNSIPSQFNNAAEPKNKRLKEKDESQKDILSLPVVNSGRAFSQLEQLPQGVAKLLIDNLPFKSFLAFEQASKKCMQLCRLRWKVLLAAHKLDFEWGDCTGTLYPERTQFILGKIVHTYAQARIVEEPNYQQIVRRFIGMMKPYPSFGIFVYKDLQRKVSFEENEKAYFEKLALQATPSRDLKGGDLLLNALENILTFDQVRDDDPDEYHAKTKAFSQRLSQSVWKAISANATCASLFAAKLIRFDFCTGDFKDLLASLGMLAIGKNFDYRALEALRDDDPDDLGGFSNIDDQELLLPPLLVDRARDREDLVEAEKDYEQAIEGYGTQVPLQVLVEAAKLKKKLNKYEESGELFARGILYSEEYGTAPLKVDEDLRIILTNVACELHRAKKWKEADAIYSKAFADLQEIEPVSWESLLWAAETKSRLGQWAEADELYTYGFDNAKIFNEEDDPHWHDLFEVAFVNIQLEKWDVANEYYEEGLVKAIRDDAKISHKHAFNIAYTRAKTGQWVQAKIMLEKLIGDLKEAKEEIPPKVESLLAEIQKHLGHSAS